MQLAATRAASRAERLLRLELGPEETAASGATPPGPARFGRAPPRSNCDGDRWRGPRGVRRHDLVARARLACRRGCGGHVSRRRRPLRLSRHQSCGRHPVPVPTPTPAFTAYMGRLSGTWLLGQELGSEATSAGAYPRELLLSVRPRCDKGPCSVTASLVDPRTGKTLASKRVKRTDGKYRFAIKAAITDLCRGDDGRTVQGGAKRTTEFQLQPFVDSKTGEMVLAATGSLRLNPNRRGDSVGCRDTKSEISVQAEKLTKATRATVKQRLSPIPQPDLVPRPDFAVSIKGVRIGLLPGEGHQREEATGTMGRDLVEGKVLRRGRIQLAQGQRPNVVLHQVARRISTGRTWPTRSPAGAPSLGSQVNRRMSMPIARWAGPSLVPRGLVRWWKATQRYVRDHEAGHVAIYREWNRSYGRESSERTAPRVEAIIDKWSNQVNAAQEAYDKREYARTDRPPYPADAS